MPPHTTARPGRVEMSPARRAARRTTAIHEAAHAVITTVLGHRVRKVSIGTDPQHPHRNGSCAYSTRFADQDRAAICYAGPYAEAYHLHGGPPTSAAIRRALADTEDYTAMTAAGDTRPAHVPRLVASCWDSIIYLADHLLINGSAAQADVDRALKLPRDDVDGRHHALAVIRSGSTPDPFTIAALGSRS